MQSVFQRQHVSFWWIGDVYSTRRALLGQMLADGTCSL